MSDNEKQNPASNGVGSTDGSAANAAYRELPPLLRGCTDRVDFCAGFKAAEKRHERMIELLFAAYEFLPAGTIRDEADALLAPYEQPNPPNIRSQPHAEDNA